MTEFFFHPAYYYPPVRSVGVLRNRAATESARERGFSVVVATGRCEGEFRAGPGIRVLRTRVLDYRTRPSRAGGEFAPPATLKRGLAYRAFRILSNGFPSNLALGEGGPLYISAAYLRLTRAIREAGGRGLLYSSFRPWADHQIAFLLKRRFPDLTWWQDWRDAPFDLRRDSRWFARSQSPVVTCLLRRADVVSAVSHGVAADLLRHGADVDVDIVRNGTVRPHPRSATPDAIPRICYTGSLYGADRDPSPLFRALHKLHRDGIVFEVVYAGKDGAQWMNLADRFGLRALTRDVGRLPQDRALALQKAAAVNVLLTWANPDQVGGLTMKTYEYLQAGQPIVRIHDGPPDAELDEVIRAAHSPTFTYAKRSADDRGLFRWLEARLRDYRVLPTQPGHDLRGRLDAYFATRIEPLFARAAP